MPWAKTRASPIIRKLLVLMLFGVAARIGASIVARLANIPDISCIERLASTNSGPQRTCVSLCYGLLLQTNAGSLDHLLHPRRFAPEFRIELLGRAADGF